MDEVVAKMEDGQAKLKKGQLVTAIISSATDEGVAVLLPFFKKETLLEKEELECETYNKEEYAAKAGEDIEVMVVSTNPVKISQKIIAKIKEEEEKIDCHQQRRRVRHRLARASTKAIDRVYGYLHRLRSRERDPYGVCEGA